MKRRKFIQATTASTVSLPILLNGMQVSAITSSPLFQHLNTDNDRVLVLIQLIGGNDGLNMLVPLDQYDNLANARANVILPESSVLSVDNTNGLHPVMTGIKSLYDDAKIGIVQSVGYPNQNRSHFRSTDIWTSGSGADEYISTGWMGRYFDTQHPDFPNDYPNADHPDPIALTMGFLVSETCQGVAANFSMALTDPFTLGQLATGEGSTPPNTPYGDELTFLRDTIAQTNAYADTIVDAANSGSNMANYPADNRLAQQLKNVALLISGGLKTKVYVVALGGFDTHANQVDPTDTTTGIHANLLKTVSDAVAVFQEDLKLLGLEDRVLGMTFSEFGRRIISNFSVGTDHGTAAPLMVFGKCIKPGILGDNPEIPAQPDVQDGVPMQFDFRSVYGSVLMDWFEVPENDVKNILYPDFQYIPMLDPCAVSSTKESESYYTEEINAYNFPNPFGNYTTIAFESENEWVRVSIFDSLGHELRVLADRKFASGTHQLQFEAHDLPAGNYFFRIQMEGKQKTKLMVRR